MRWLAIINPQADHHTTEQLQTMEKFLQQTVGADSLWTSYPNHTGDIVAEHPEYDGYIAIGGDGTVAEVVNAMDERRQRLGVIPAGTANDFARDLQVDSERVGLNALHRPRFQPIDCVTVGFHTWQGWQKRTMVTLSALGYIAETTALYRRYSRARHWSFYGVAAFLQCFRQRPFAARLRLDHGPWRPLMLTNIVLQNTQSAGGFRLFPEARLDDGKFNVLYGNLTVTQQLFEDLGILTQTYLFQHSTRCVARHADIELCTPAIFMIDGDIIPGVDALRYEIAPGRLSCLQPKALSAHLEP
jgi:diacylglycerol kinase (ATP)